MRVEKKKLIASIASLVALLHVGFLSPNIRNSYSCPTKQASKKSLLFDASMGAQLRFTLVTLFSSAFDFDEIYSSYLS